MHVARLTSVEASWLEEPEVLLLTAHFYKVKDTGGILFLILGDVLDPGFTLYRIYSHT